MIFQPMLENQLSTYWLLGVTLSKSTNRWEFEGHRWSTATVTRNCCRGERCTSFGVAISISLSDKSFPQRVKLTEIIVYNIMQHFNHVVAIQCSMQLHVLLVKQRDLFAIPSYNFTSSISGVNNGKHTPLLINQSMGIWDDGSWDPGGASTSSRIMNGGGWNLKCPQDFADWPQNIALKK